MGVSADVSTIGIFISFVALILSSVTAWLTLFKRGQILMTQPTIIYFGPDGGPQAKNSHLKVFLRTLLYSTGRRGHVLENMFIRLYRGETRQNFNVWAYGEYSKLSRGSGLFVPESGVAMNHHFLLPADAHSFQFIEGRYLLEVFATRAGQLRPRLLFSVHLDVTPELAIALTQSENGLYFDWGPDSRRYHAHIVSEQDRRPAVLLREMLQ